MSTIDWHEVDRFLIGESWVGSQLESNLLELCEGIGPRWAGSDAERRAAGFIRHRMEANGLPEPRLEEFPLQTWDYASALLAVAGEGEELDILPFNHCAPVHVEARLSDVGYATSGGVAARGWCNR